MTGVRGKLRVPILPNALVARLLRLVRESGHQFMSRLATIQRRDQGLQDGYSAVIGPSISPGFKEVSLRDVPVTQLRRLIVVETQVDTLLDFRERVGKRDIDRSRKDGIAPKNEEGLDGTRLHVTLQFAERLELIDGIRFHRLSVDHRAAHIAQGVIHGVSQSMDERWLVLARDHNGCARMALEVSRQGANPC